MAPPSPVQAHIKATVPLMRPETCHTDWPFRSRGPQGRPRLFYRGKTITAVRYAWYLLHERWPEAQLNHGDCHDPACWNPHHVYDGNQLSNIADMLNAGRHNVPRGEAHWRASLTNEQIRAIRSVYNGERGQQRALARTYGVSFSAINHIVHGNSR
jgi:hypothetical protein